ncbi:MAG: response regulator [Anaerolineae bacterium]
MEQERVLIIDNSAETRQLLVELVLEPHGYRFITAMDGEEGLRLALHEHPDLIILDMQLPKMNGLEVLEALRQRNADIPVIFTTIRESAELVVQAFRLGARDCVMKPLDPGRMQEAIQRVLAVVRLREERDQLTEQWLEANQQLQRQLQALNAIYAIGRSVTSLLDLDRVLSRVVEAAVYMAGAEEGMLLLLDSEGDELYLRAAKNVDEKVARSLRIRVDDSIAGRAIRADRPVLLTGERTKVATIYLVKALLYLPLRVPERGVIGVLGVTNRESERSFSERDIFVLSALADYAAIAIENARLFESVANAKALMDNIFASITSGIITTDVQDQITLFNRAAESILRKSATVVVGSRLADALPALESELRPLVEEVRRHGEPVVEFETEMSLPDRHLVHLRTSLSPLKDANDETQGIAIVVDDLTERSRLEARYQLFQRYLSPAVIERLPDDPHELRLGGQRQEITSLFADIRGFTDFSQQQGSETLVEVLNQYLAVGAEAVLAEEGTLDKFMGDAVVAFFNAPLPQSDHVLRAVRAALKIQEGIALLHERVPPSYRLAYGVGISVGDAVVGNIGIPQRLDYTAIGSSVNLAYRLQEAAAAGQILLSHTAYQRAREQIKARPLPSIRAKGISEPIKVYELLGLS